MMLPYIGISLLAVFLIYEFWIKADFPYEYGMHYAEESRVSEIESFGEQCGQRMQLTEEVKVPNYENTVIWTFRDSKDGQLFLVDYGPLYELPTGFGINLCDEVYLEEHFENLKSRYIAVGAEGDLAERCVEKGYHLIASTSEMKLYDRR